MKTKLRFILLLAIISASIGISDASIRSNQEMNLNGIDVYVPDGSEIYQDIEITMYAPDRTSVLMNAPIFIGNVQYGYGTVIYKAIEGNKKNDYLRLTYIISTNNDNLPGLYPPDDVSWTVVPCHINGQCNPHIKMYFSDSATIKIPSIIVKQEKKSPALTMPIVMVGVIIVAYIIKKKNNI